MYHLMEFGLILDLQKLPSFLKLCLFDKYLQSDKLLEEETDQAEEGLFTMLQFP